MFPDVSVNSEYALFLHTLARILFVLIFELQNFFVYSFVYQHPF